MLVIFHVISPSLAHLFPHDRLVEHFWILEAGESLIQMLISLRFIIESFSICINLLARNPLKSEPTLRLALSRFLYGLIRCNHHFFALLLC